MANTIKNTQNWFPGHMVKALREIKERLKIVDIVVELIDSRLPISSKNPFLSQLIENKIKILVFTKKDLTDLNKISYFETYYKDQGYKTLICDLNNPQDIKKISSLIVESGQPIRDKLKAKGMKIRPLRVMIVGIPNVGKSTLINRLVNKKVSKVQNRPGQTVSQQFVRINDKFDLIDTPGILMPHYEDRETMLHISLINSLKQDIIPKDDLFLEAIKVLTEKYPDEFRNFYSIVGDLSYENIVSSIGNRRKLFEKENNVSLEKVQDVLLKEFRDGTICKMVIDDARL